MGRPLKKKLYQDPAAPGAQFDEVDAWIPRSTETLFEITPGFDEPFPSVTVYGYNPSGSVGSLSPLTFDLPGNPGATIVNFIVAFNAGPESGAGVGFSHPGGTLVPSEYTLYVRLGEDVYAFTPNAGVSTASLTAFGSTDLAIMNKWKAYFEKGFGNTMPVYLSQDFGQAEKCYITSQTGTHKFYCVGKESGNEGVCRIADKDAGSLENGEMNLTCTPFGGSPERIRSISTNKVRTFGGDQYAWKADESADAVGEADIDQLVGDGTPFNLTVGFFEDSGPPEVDSYGFTFTIAGAISPNTLTVGDNIDATIFTVASGRGAPDPDALIITMSHPGGAAVPSGGVVNVTIDGSVYTAVLSDGTSDANLSVFFIAGASVTPAHEYLLSENGNTVPISLQYVAP